MDAKKEARTLFHDFNRWRKQTAFAEKIRAEGKFYSNYKETPERLEIFEDLAVWCRGHQIDPRLWVYILFKARSWMFPPKLQASHLKSDNILKRYEKLTTSSLDGYRTHILREYGDIELAFDPNWEISFYAEAIKKKYTEQGDYTRCMREIFENTLGYHPKSNVCQKCPVRKQCEFELRRFVDFDIMSLRRGDITPAQARAQIEWLKVL